MKYSACLLIGISFSLAGCFISPIRQHREGLIIIDKQSGTTIGRRKSFHKVLVFTQHGGWRVEENGLGVKRRRITSLGTLDDRARSMEPVVWAEADAGGTA